MTIELDVNTDIRRLLSKLDNVQSKQIPFATALALTNTAKGLLTEQKREMRRSFHKPVAYTMKALAYQSASKNDKPIKSRVFFREFAGKGTPAYKYLTPNIKGERRRQKRHERLLSAKIGRKIYTAPATGAPVNAAGNINGGYYSKVLSQLQAFGETGFRANARRKGSQGFYIATKGGKAVGVRKREGDVSRKILNFVDTAPNYKRRYDLYGSSDRYISSKLASNFRKALRFALKTAR